MKIIQFTVEIKDDYTLRNVIIDINTTDLPSNKELLRGIAKAILTDESMDKIVEQANKIINKEDESTNQAGQIPFD